MKNICITITLSGGNDKQNVDQYKSFEFDIEAVKKRCTIPDSNGKVELLNNIMGEFMLHIEIEMCEMMRTYPHRDPLKQKGVVSKTFKV